MKLRDLAHKKRKHGSLSGISKHKMSKVMSEYAAGTLRSGSGHKVTSRAQAIAIGYSEGAKKRRKK